MQNKTEQAKVWPPAVERLADGPSAKTGPGQGTDSHRWGVASYALSGVAIFCFFMYPALVDPFFRRYLSGYAIFDSRVDVVVLLWRGGMLLLLAALISGIVGFRSRPGKIGLCLTLIAFLGVVVYLFATMPNFNEWN